MFTQTKNDLCWPSPWVAARLLRTCGRHALTRCGPPLKKRQRRWAKQRSIRRHMGLSENVGDTHIHSNFNGEHGDNPLEYEIHYSQTNPHPDFWSFRNQQLKHPIFHPKLFVFCCRWMWISWFFGNKKTTTTENTPHLRVQCNAEGWLSWWRLQ